MEELSGAPELVKVLLHSVNSQQLLRQLMVQLQQDHNLQLDELIQLFEEVKQEPLIPFSIFSHQLAPAEALCIYLKEVEQWSLQEIAHALGRDKGSVWATCQRAKKRKHTPFLKSRNRDNNYVVPLSIFHDRSRSILENSIQHVHQVYHLSNPQIAKFLHKSPNSIAVIHKRAREKK